MISSNEFKRCLQVVALGLASAVSMASGAPQPTLDVPLVGAQVFIERGQTAADIDRWFALLEAHGMKLCRIRMFENYMRAPDGTWDFTLFDHAFRSAEKHGVRILGTLFPATPFSDVGGFKFPRTAAHQAAVADYIHQVTSHFRQFPASYGWVLINEPGCGKPPLDEALTRERFETWQANQTPVTRRDGYSVWDFSKERFLVDHNVWYLDWLATEVRKHDPDAHLHVNNHNIFSTAAEYDFPRWRGFLDSLGGSAHASWHFRYFSRSRYAHAMLANSEMIHSGAGPLPWIMTELQGGNNTYSGTTPMCPTPEEISQWLWTILGTGGKGAIFWSLNARASGMEAGEWALLDFRNQASDRLTAAGEVAATVNRHAGLFASARAVEPAIAVLYTRESLWAEKAFQCGEAPLDGRLPGGVMKSSLGYFETLAEMGLPCALREINEYDFSANNFSGKTIILAHQVSVPARHWPLLESFVSKGGKLIADGLTGMLDENAHCVMMTGFPGAALMGGSVREYKLVGNLFDVALTSPVITLPGHCWRGSLEPGTGQSISTSGGAVTALRNRFGKGETVWIPAMLGLAARLKESAPLAAFLAAEAAPSVAAAPARFDRHQPAMLMRTLESGGTLITVIIHKGSAPADVKLQIRDGLTPEILVANKGGHMTGPSSVLLHPEETAVIHWRPAPRSNEK